MFQNEQHLFNNHVDIFLDYSKS